MGKRIGYGCMVEYVMGLQIVLANVPVYPPVLQVRISDFFMSHQERAIKHCWQEGMSCRCDELPVVVSFS